MSLSVEWLKEKPIAHRGLHDGSDVPENSLAAFLKAISLGYPIELDVQLLGDDEIVIFHDKNLKRMTGVDKLLVNETRENLHKYRLADTDEKIPTLVEALQLIKGKVPVLVDIKNEGYSYKLEERLVEVFKDYKGLYAIESFNPFSVAWYKKNASNVYRGQISGTFNDEKLNICKKIILRNFLLNWYSQPNFVSVEFALLAERKIKRFRREDVPILSWTIKNMKDYKFAKQYCDNIIFEGFLP